MDLGTLLLEFLDLYGRRFDFTNMGLCPQLHPRSFGSVYYTLLRPTNSLAITDPLDPLSSLDPTLANNVGRGVFAMYRIKAAFHYALCILVAPFAPLAHSSLLSRILEGPAPERAEEPVAMSKSPASVTSGFSPHFSHMFLQQQQHELKQSQSQSQSHMRKQNLSVKRAPISPLVLPQTRKRESGSSTGAASGGSCGSGDIDHTGTKRALRGQFERALVIGAPRCVRVGFDACAHTQARARHTRDTHAPHT